jgi:hypothetical protein
VSDAERKKPFGRQKQEPFRARLLHENSQCFRIE